MPYSFNILGLNMSLSEYVVVFFYFRDLKKHDEIMLAATQFIHLKPVRFCFTLFHIDFESNKFN